MKSTAFITALAGLASTSMASLSVQLVFDKTNISVGETAIATITATFTGEAGSYFSSASFDLIASDPDFARASPLTGLGWAMPVLGTPSGGVVDGANITGIFGAQQSLFGAPNTSNPFVIGSFVITGTSGTWGSLIYTVRASANTPGAFSYTDNTGPFAAPIYANGEVFTSGMISVVPSPGGVVVLAAGGLVVGRRRR